MEQITLSRRSFFGGALALIAATQLPSSSFASAPTIYGDGIRDDTAGLQAAFDGKPFRVVGQGVYVVNKDGRVFLSGGSFRLRDTLHIRHSAVVTGGRFDGRELPKDGRPILHVHNSPKSNPVMLANMHIQGHGHGTVILAEA